MSDEELAVLSQRAADVLQGAKLRLATAESCTGGWVAKVVTDIAGSSEWFVCGFTTYSNNAKSKLLGVSDITLEQHGAVSEDAAFEMVEGALYRTEADVAVSVTGIAGPDGGSKEKPVGTVCFAWGRRNQRVKTETRHFDGERDAVRRQATAHALQGLIDYVGYVEPAREVKEEPIVPSEPAMMFEPAKARTPFDMIDDAKAALAELLDRLRLPDYDDEVPDVDALGEKYGEFAASVAAHIDFPRAVRGIAETIRDACAIDPDAMVGFAHLDDTGPYTVLHPLHQVIFGEVFASYLRLAPEERLSMACAAITSNIAMLDLQEILWRQAGPLKPTQQKLIRLHPAWARAMLERLGVDDALWLDAVLAHHERADGKGYPLGMSGENIPMAARIIALTDIYDAMVMPRQHRPPNPRAALRDLFLKRGQAIDADLSSIAIKALGVYPPGTFVKLQNGEIGVVIKRVAGNVHPIVRSLIGPRGAPLERPFRRNTDAMMYNIQDVVARDPRLALNLRRIWDYAP